MTTNVTRKVNRNFESGEPVRENDLNHFSNFNKSGLRPLGHAVLVEPYEPQEKKSAIVLPETVRERTLMIETRAIVVEAGPECWNEERAPRAKPGDHVMIARMAGSMVTGILDGKTYRMVNDRDIFCALEVKDNG